MQNEAKLTKKGQITIPKDIYELNSIITALDTSKNLARQESNRVVIDNDPPEIVDLTSKDPKTGNSFILKCSVFENRLIKNVYIEYWFDNREQTLENISLMDSDYLLQVNVPLNAKTLKYTITAEDEGENVETYQNSLNVIDMIPPTIYDQTKGEPTTGEEYKIEGYAEDNIGIETLYLEYGFIISALPEGHPFPFQVQVYPP